jgi:hypothetical protein
MAGKTRSRIELRRQYEAAEAPDPMEDEAEDVVADDAEEEEKPKKKPKAAPKKPRASKAKAVKPSARMRIVWQVVNEGFKVVATFDYSQKDAAEAKAAEMIAKGKGHHFVQKVKEPMPEDAPGLGANIPRIAVAAPTPKAAPARRSKKVEVEEEEPEDDDVEEEEEDMDDDDE